MHPHNLSADRARTPRTGRYKKHVCTSIEMRSRHKVVAALHKLRQAQQLRTRTRRGQYVCAQDHESV